MPPKVGLVLGGGGTRGIAHIGVLQVLVREGIPIDLIVGTSMGGIVGALFALGYTPEHLADRVREMQRNPLINVKHLSARARQRMLCKLLAEALNDRCFDDLNLDVALMAVDMLHGTEVTLTEGPLMPAVLATSAVPAVFPPVELNGMQLADGGVIDSLATHVAFELGAEKVIAVDVYPPLETGDPWIDPLSAIMGFQLPFNLSTAPESGKTPGMFAAMWRAVRVMAWHIHEKRLAAHPPDVLLRPRVAGYGSLDFRNMSGPLAAGVAEAERCLPELRALLELSAVV